MTSQTKALFFRKGDLVVKRIFALAESKHFKLKQQHPLKFCWPLRPGIVPVWMCSTLEHKYSCGQWQLGHSTNPVGSALSALAQMRVEGEGWQVFSSTKAFFSPMEWYNESTVNTSTVTQCLWSLPNSNLPESVYLGFFTICIIKNEQIKCLSEVLRWSGLHQSVYSLTLESALPLSGPTVSTQGVSRDGS